MLLTLGLADAAHLIGYCNVSIEEEMRHKAFIAQPHSLNPCYLPGFTLPTAARARHSWS